MFFKRDKVTLMVREADLSDTVRSPIDASEASKLLKHMKKWQGKVNVQWKTRFNAHQKALEEGNPYGYAEVFKVLSALEQEGKLRMTDRAHLKQSEQLLSEELANALGKSQDEIRKQMTRVAHTELAGEQHQQEQAGPAGG